MKMRISCGTDIIEIDRIKESIESLGQNFLERVFTEKEIQYCEGKKGQRFQHYAARFAAKEAIFKAISSEFIEEKNKFEIGWKDYEVENDPLGRPKVSKGANFLNNKFCKNKIHQIDISLSHCKKYAIENVIVVWNEMTEN